MSLVIHCPNCQQQLNLSPQHIGRKLNCPGCGQSLHVSLQVVADRIKEVAPIPPPVQAIRSQPRPSYDEIRRKVRGPAIGLFITGAGTTLMGLMFLPAILFPELIEPNVPPEPFELLLSIFFMIATLVLGILVLYGAIKFFTLENYRLSMAASIAAMVPCYCCFLGLPFGIWSLMVLRDADVRAAFKQQINLG